MRNRENTEVTGIAHKEEPQTETAVRKKEDKVREYKEVEPEKDKHTLLKPKRVKIRAIITHDKS